MDDLVALTEGDYVAKSKAAGKLGRLVVRDFPTGTAHSGHFRSYMAELKQKSKFIPDIICVDYLNICSSERIRSGGNAQQYVVIGSIARELRALAQQSNTVVWSATQANRQGLKGPVGLANTSDSIQIGYDADLVLAMWKDDTLPGLLHLSVEKDRNGGAAGKHGMVAVQPSKMKVLDLSGGPNSSV